MRGGPRLRLESGRYLNWYGDRHYQRSSIITKRTKTMVDSFKKFISEEKEDVNAAYVKAMTHSANHRHQWEKDHYEKEDGPVPSQDVHDLHKAAELAKAGKHKEAIDHHDSLDTDIAELPHELGHSDAVDKYFEKHS